MDKDIVQALRDHVNSRGGPSKNENGEVIMKNGAWDMMLEAADEIEKLRGVITGELPVYIQ